MASRLRDRSDMEGVYKQMHNASSGDLLWGGKTARGIKRKATLPLFPVERLISKRTVRNTVEYLVKWQGYSAFDNSWEPEDNLSAELLRTYNRPKINSERLMRNLDALRVAVTTKLKSQSRNNLIFDFDHDCFRFLFFGKGKQSRDKNYILFGKEDFRNCKFVDNWDNVFDVNGDGVMIKYPVKVRPLLKTSPKSYAIINGTLQESQRMVIEKLAIDFEKLESSKVPTVH